MDIHPAIRIVCLLIFAMLVVLGQWADVWLGALLLLIGYLAGGVGLVKGMNMLLRLRWLLLSILLVYLWFTPGVPLLAGQGGWVPSQQGLENGLHRVLCLMLLVFAVSLFLQSTSTANMVAALLWLLYPLQWLGVDHQRLAVRIALTMTAVDEIQLLYREHFSPVSGLRQRIRQWARALVVLFEQVTRHAQQLPERDIEVPVLAAPRWHQWSLPLVIIILFVTI